MSNIHVKQMTRARIPTEMGEFHLCYYQNNLDHKEHLALVMGDIQARPDILVRIHSECFTGDVLGSLRCDCGPQLNQAMRLIAAEGAGIIIYLRQEGRGIGLYDKLRAYNLQDEGYDTVEANLMLGHQADGRDYTLAALMLRDLGVTSFRLLTNNPDKLESLAEMGLTVTKRVPLAIPPNQENAAYLQTKMERMRHLLQLNRDAAMPLFSNNGRPHITLSYAQSLDGSITVRRGQPLALSGPESLRMTHQLRASHDAILVGIGTVLADNPSLTVRLVDGPQPQPVIVDSRLRFPLSAKLLRQSLCPWIFTTEAASPERQAALEAAGACVFRVASDVNGRVDLDALLHQLKQRGIHSVMVEGGASIITSFLTSRLVDRLVLTVAPLFVGGLNAVGNLSALNGHGLPHLTNLNTRWLGQDMVLSGDVDWRV